MLETLYHLLHLPLSVCVCMCSLYTFFAMLLKLLPRNFFLSLDFNGAFFVHNNRFKHFRRFDFHFPCVVFQESIVMQCCINNVVAKFFFGILVGNVISLFAITGFELYWIGLHVVDHFFCFEFCNANYTNFASRHFNNIYIIHAFLQQLISCNFLTWKK